MNTPPVADTAPLVCFPALLEACLNASLPPALVPMPPGTGAAAGRALL